MRKRNFFFKIVVADLLAEILTMTQAERGQFIIDFALDLNGDDVEKCKTDFAKQLISEANGYREKAAEYAKRRWEKRQKKQEVNKAPNGTHIAPITSNNSSNSNSNNKDKYSTEFERFWSTYPKKTGKGAAYKSWKKQKPSVEDVLAALSWQMKSKQWCDGFIPNPTTYLNQNRWEDEPDVEAPNRTYNFNA